MLTIVVRKEIGHLVDANAMQLRMRNLVIEPVPDRDRDVFCGGDGGLELGNFKVQMPVIVDADDFALEDVFQLLQIDDKA